MFYFVRFLTPILLLSAVGGCSQVRSTDTATVAGGSATLIWAAPTTNTNDSPLTDLAGYYIYYGSSADTMTQMITLVDAQATSYVVKGLTSGTWYFAIEAYDSAGNRSALSNVAAKTL